MSEFKALDWVESPMFGVTQILEVHPGETYKIGHDGRWWGSIKGSALSHFTLRAGDWAKDVDGLHDSVERRLILAGENAGFLFNRPSKGDSKAYLYFGKHLMVFSAIAGFNFTRELTIEQILSTLPDEHRGKTANETIDKVIAAGKEIIKNRTQIDWTKPIQTRDGTKSLYLGKLADGRASVITQDKNDANHWYGLGVELDGKYLGNPNGSYDIINVPEERKLEGWVNVYNDGILLWSHDEEGAELCESYDCIARIDLGKHNITYFNGEGL